MCVKLHCFRFDSRTISSCPFRLGVNVVPLIAPPEVRFPDKMNLPFENGTCVNTAWTLLEGTESRSRVPWADSGWTAGIHRGSGCSQKLWAPRKMSLRQAVMECSSSKCHAIGLVGAENEALAKLTDSELLQRLQKDDTEHLFGGLGRCYDENGAESFTVQTGQTMLVKPKQPLNNVIDPVTTEASDTWTVVFARTITKQAKYTNPTTGNKEKVRVKLEHVAPPRVIIVGRQVFQSSGGIGAKDSAPAVGWKCALSDQEVEEAFKPVDSKSNAIKQAFKKATYSNRNLALPYVVGQTYLKDLYKLFCPDGTQNGIEIELPNGVYEVTTHFGNGYDEFKQDGSPKKKSGRRHYDTLCTVEGMMVANTQSKQKLSPIQVVKRVELMDGKMTVSWDD